MRNTSWRDTLFPFLEASNEDRIYTNFFRSAVPALLRSRISKSNKLNWLDVGAGPGTKARALLTVLGKTAKSVKLSALDADPQWAPFFCEGGAFDEPSLASRCDFLCQALDDFLNAVKPGDGFDLVTSFHVVYAAPLVVDLAHLIDMFSNAFFIITAESENSDLNTVRRTISSQLGIETAKSHLSQLASHRKLFDRTTRTLKLSSKYLWLTPRSIGSVAEPGWLPAFLIGTTMSAINAMEPNLRLAYLRLIKDVLQISTSTARRLDIPDDVLIVFPRNLDVVAR